MTPTYRPYQTEEDFWRMRALLRQTLVLNDYRESCWHVARLDYARWHTCLNCAKVTLNEVATLWESDGNLVAFLMPDGGRGEAHLNIHPGYKTPELEEEMLDAAEALLAAGQAGSARELFVWSPAQDVQRQEMLIRRGYTRDEADLPEIQHRCRLEHRLAETPLAPGYTLRALGDGLELLERCYASGLGFHEGDIQIAVDNRNDPTWYRNIQTAPLYRRDLDLVAVAPDGAIAAFTTIWFDDVTRSAYFEPVATVPSHQRRGLGKALMSEGLRRLQRLGAMYAFVGGYTPAANALYFSIMGAEHTRYAPWVRRWA